jgi:hypothetical protein
MVCHICDKLIAIEDFEFHTILCVSAYKSENQIEGIDLESSRLRDLIIVKLPTGPGSSLQGPFIAMGMPKL